MMEIPPTKNYVYHASGEYSTDVNNIWGLAPNNIFACGTIGYPGSYPGGLSDSLQGFVLHYDGTSWAEVAKGDINYQFLSIRSEYNNQNNFLNNNYKSNILAYKLSNVSSDSAIFAFYQSENSNLKKIYSNTRGNIHYISLSSINELCYFLLNIDVFT